MLYEMQNAKISQIIEEARKTYIEFATGGEVGYETLEEARGKLLSIVEIRSAIPDWIVSNRWGNQFWDYIKAKFPHYKERRLFINEGFAQILTYHELGGDAPISFSVSTLLNGDDYAEIRSTWNKMLIRLPSDHEGAITLARSMVESTLQYILAEDDVAVTNSDDLPSLYKKVAGTLNLSPGGHEEAEFKMILSGLTTSIHGITRLRNLYGDAHGKSTPKYRIEHRHAELAVNLAGTLCTFLLESYKRKREQSS